MEGCCLGELSHIHQNLEALQEILVGLFIAAVRQNIYFLSLIISYFNDLLI